MQKLACFKAYDIRGRVPEDLDEDLVCRIGQAYAAVVQPGGPVAVGRDIRESSEALAAALGAGLRAAGVDSVDLGLCGTEMVYHAAAQPGRGGGIMVTASHNPKGDNGLKLVVHDLASNLVRPVDAEAEMPRMEALVRQGPLPAGGGGRALRSDVLETYREQVLGFLAGRELASYKVVVNAGNGCAGPVLDALAADLPFELVRLHHAPDGSFPHGVPNPLLVANRAVTSAKVLECRADFGVAWDGDFDRCFLFDHTGDFVEGYYIVGLLAEALLAEAPGGLIVHDPRLYWNTQQVVARAGGAAVKSRTGHARIKAVMAGWDCLYGGEMSAHHYFRDFHHCDSGMVPWLLVAALLAARGTTLRELVAERLAAFPCSGELNYTIPDPQAVWRQLLRQYAPAAPQVDFFDGLSLTCDDWRCNLRSSDTERTQLRLNVESRGDEALMCRQRDAIDAVLRAAS
ncbi:MAG: phosphomannomutase CpsG [Fimbriimonadaceae bacterium]|nr:phosphomannomutase CpsG [Fimbriimonadaceae bacterium]